MENYKKTIDYLKKKKNILFLTTSNRWSDSGEVPKSTSFAYEMAKELDNVKIIDVSKLLIYGCEGNVSSIKGNSCGLKDALLKDDKKNPSGYHRCWASINHKDDELWKISKELFDSDVVVFFGSVRWGKMNHIYANLIERLTWIENRHATLGESNIVKDIDAGLICIGHNWNGENVIELEKEVFKFFGFKTPKELFWNYQWTKNSGDESQAGYKKDALDFEKKFNIKVIKENLIILFRNFIK